MLSSNNNDQIRVFLESIIDLEPLGGPRGAFFKLIEENGGDVVVFSDEFGVLVSVSFLGVSAEGSDFLASLADAKCCDLWFQKALRLTVASTLVENSKSTGFI